MERSTSSEEMNQALSDAAMISSARTTKSTKDQYGRKMVHAVSWFKDRHPEVVRGNDILYESLLPEHLPEFFASMARKKDSSRSRKRGTYHSFEHVSGYKSAIRDDMKTKRFRPSADVDCAIDNFFAGGMLYFSIYI
jgi:hypothetical protein